MSAPPQYTGRLSRDQIIGIVPQASDVVFFIDFDKINWDDPVVDSLLVRFMSMNYFAEDSEFDIKKDVFSIYVGMNVPRTDNYNVEYYIVINHSYPKESLLQKLSNDGFELNDTARNKAYPEYRKEGLPMKTFILGDSILIIASGDKYDSFIESSDKTIIDNKSVLKIKLMLNATNQDAVITGIMPELKPLLDSLGERQQNNPMLNMFDKEDSVTVTIDMKINGYSAEGFLKVNDEKRRAQVFGIVSLMLMVAGQNKDLDQDTKSFIESIKIKNDPAGVKASLFIDSRLGIRLLEKYGEGISWSK
jgi:hypothetical protein